MNVRLGQGKKKKREVVAGQHRPLGQKRCKEKRGCVVKLRGQNLSEGLGEASAFQGTAVTY